MKNVTSFRHLTPAFCVCLLMVIAMGSFGIMGCNQEKKRIPILPVGKDRNTNSNNKGVGDEVTDGKLDEDEKKLLGEYRDIQFEIEDKKIQEHDVKILVKKYNDQVQQTDLADFFNLIGFYKDTSKETEILRELAALLSTTEKVLSEGNVVGYLDDLKKDDSKTSLDLLAEDDKEEQSLNIIRAAFSEMIKNLKEEEASQDKLDKKDKHN